LPNRAGTYGIDDRGDPRGAAAIVDIPMVGLEAIGRDPGYLRELSVGDVRQDLRLRHGHAIDPLRAGAIELAIDGLRLAMCSMEIGAFQAGPGWRHSSARSALGLEQIGQRGMFEARVLRG